MKTKNETRIQSSIGLFKNYCETYHNIPMRKNCDESSPEYIEGAKCCFDILVSAFKNDGKLSQSEMVAIRKLCIRYGDLGRLMKDMQESLKKNSKPEIIKRILNFLDISMEDLKTLTKIQLLSLASIQELPKSLLDKIRKYPDKEPIEKVLTEIKTILENRDFEEKDFDKRELTEEEEEQEKKKDIQDYMDELSEDQEFTITKSDQDQILSGNIGLEEAYNRSISVSKLVDAGEFPLEMLDYLAKSQIQMIWSVVYNRPKEDVEAFITEKLCTMQSKFQKKVFNEFLSEYIKSRDLIIPDDWKFQVNGIPVQPTLMQKLTAVKVSEQKQFGNWSETGTGKTISAILSSRVLKAKTTLVLAVNSTIIGWRNQIMESFDNSRVYEKTQISSDTILSRDSGYNYILINYEEFQDPVKYEKKWKPFIFQNPIDFVVIDEIQKVKAGEQKKLSERRKTTERLLEDIDMLTYGRDINTIGRCVPMLVMSATPVINSVNEGDSIISLLTGKVFEKRRSRSLTKSAYDLHFKICRYGIRIVEPDPANSHIKKLKIKSSLPGNVHKYSQMKDFNERSEIAVIKLNECYNQNYLTKGIPTIIYTELVNKGVIDSIKSYLVLKGFTVGEFTGRNDRDRVDDFDDFINGKFEVLIASSPIGTGVDRLQSVCNRMIMINAPWTYAGYHQLVGRLNRKGTKFNEIEIIWPTIEYAPGVSPDDNKILRIKYKNDLADAVMCGILPENIISKDDLMRMAEEKLAIFQEKERAGKKFGHNYEMTLLAPELEVSNSKKPRVRGNLNQRDYFSEIQGLNQRINTSYNKDIWGKIITSREDWINYHELRKDIDRNYLNIIVQEFMKSNRPKIVGDFGCGDNTLRSLLPENYKVISVDKYQIDPSVIACDLQNMKEHIKDSSIDIAVYALSLWGRDWENTLVEAYRVLDYDGKIIICEPQSSDRLKVEKVTSILGNIGFINIENHSYGDKYYYLTASK